MTYDEARNAEQLRVLDLAICEFILRYNSRTLTASRQTLILFPGGLGSQLMKAWTRYRDEVEAPQTFSFQPVWLNSATFMPCAPNTDFGSWNALQLRMHEDEQGGYRDNEDRIVVANGAIDFDGLSPYSHFIDWCEDHDIDWFIYGWDWRRRFEDTVEFFLKKFLPRFRSRIFDFCDGADPLANFSLVGHSFGGMIVNLILRESEHDPIAVKMKRAITVATPFYGYSGQIHHWFDLDDEFFSLLAPLGKENVIEVISSLPAVYTLNWLDLQTYNTYKSQLETGPYPLKIYPSMDATNPREPADPYNPQTNGTLVRYPTKTGFDPEELSCGRSLSRRLVEPLTERLSEKFYNIRGIKFASGSVVNDTINNTTWGWISADWNADSGETPIKDGPKGPGDDTLPAWSTHLITLPEKNRITIEDSLDHMFIMDKPSIQNKLGQLLEVIPPAKLKKPRALRLPEPASYDETRAYVRGLQGLGDDKDRAEYRDGFTQGQLRSIARRIMMNLLK
jgi:hypothetical protein